jgi:uncharacterized membrane protein
LLDHDVAAMPVASPPPYVPDAQLCVVARRNDALGPRGRWTAFALVASVSLGFGAGFVAAGAWPVLPWSVLEVVVLAIAFACIARRAGDWERLTVDGDRVIVERQRAGRLERCEWNRRWLHVAVTSDERGRPKHVLLEGGGRSVEFGALLRAEACSEVAQQLRRLVAR